MDEKKDNMHGIERALSLLEMLSFYPRGVSLADLAGKTDIPKSSLHRLLKELQSAGYVCRTGTGGYSLTFKVCELSNRLLSGLDILELSIPFVRKLCAQSRETVHLVIPSGTEIVYIRKEEPLTGALRSMSYTGFRRPMYLTSAGKSILSLLPEEKVRDIWTNTEITAVTGNTITTYEDFLSALRVARKQGYALDDEENEVGIRCIGAAIRNFAGEPVAAVSISAPTNRMTRERIDEMTPSLIETANSISALLGYQAGCPSKP